MALYFSVRSTLVVTPRPTLAITRVAHFQKISFLIFTAPPPTPPPPGEKIRKEIFGVRGRFSPTKRASIKIVYFVALFSVPCAHRGVPVTEYGGYSITRSHYAPPRIGTLTSVRVACSVLLGVRSVASLEFVGIQNGSRFARTE